MAGSIVVRAIGTVLVTVVVVASPLPAQAGTVLWRTEFDGGGHTIDAAHAVVTDAAGDVFAGGLTDDRAARQTDFTVVKVDGATGQLRWREAVHGPDGSQGFGAAEEVKAIAVDGAGDAVAAGSLFSDEHGYDFAVVKFDGASGQQRWRTVLHGTALGTGVVSAYDVAQAVVVDRHGDVYAGGYVNNRAVFKTFIVVKLSGTSGKVEWRREINGTGVLHNTEVAALALDPSGDVIAAGSIVESGLAEQFAVVKLTGATGKVAWRTELSGGIADPRNKQDQAVAVAVDSAGHPVAAGWLHNEGTAQDMSVVKLDNATGKVVWTRSLNGRANAGDFASAVAVDSADNVLVGGWLRNQDEFRSGFTVAKLDGVTGGLTWTNERSGGRVDALAVDGTNRVIAVGDVNHDFTVAVFDNATGAQVDGVQLNGTANSFDWGFDVAVSPTGRIIGAGSVSNRGNSSDFTVVGIQ